MKNLLFSISLLMSTGVLVCAQEPTAQEKKDLCHEIVRLASENGFPTNLTTSSCNEQEFSRERLEQEYKQALFHDVTPEELTQMMQDAQETVDSNDK